MPEELTPPLESGIWKRHNPKTSTSKLAAITGSSATERLRHRVNEILLDKNTPEGCTMAHFLANASSLMHNSSQDKGETQGGAAVSSGVAAVQNFCFAMQNYMIEHRENELRRVLVPVDVASQLSPPCDIRPS